jgi:O-antigen/teichoic acid export membrane protein
MTDRSLPRSRSRDRAAFHFKRLSGNTLLQVGSQALPLAAGAVSIPLVYRNLGAAQFGVFTIGLSALGLFSLLDLGLGRAAVRFMSRAFSRDDPLGAASVAAHSALLLSGFSVVLCIGAFGLIPFLPAHWNRLSGLDESRVRQCLYILACALPIAGVTAAFRAVLEARERFIVISAIQVVLGVSTYVLPLALSFVTADVRLILGAAVACRVLAFIAFVAAATAAWEGAFPWRDLDLVGQREFRGFSSWLVVSNLVGSVIVYGDRALLLRMFGLAEIAYYNVPLEFLGRLMIIVNSGATVVFPTLARASDDTARLDAVYSGMVPLIGLAIGVVLLALGLLAPAGLHLWLGDLFREHSTKLVRILLVGLGFQTMNVLALADLNARGVARPITVMHLLETPVYFWGLYRCGTNFGLEGVAAVWSVRLLVEFMCFAGIQASLAEPGRGVRRGAGTLIAACSMLPITMLAINGRQGPALLALGCCSMLAAAWGWARYRPDLRSATG